MMQTLFIYIYYQNNLSLISYFILFFTPKMRPKSILLSPLNISLDVHVYIIGDKFNATLKILIIIVLS